MANRTAKHKIKKGCLTPTGLMVNFVYVAEHNGIYEVRFNLVPSVFVRLPLEKAVLAAAIVRHGETVPTIDHKVQEQISLAEVDFLSYSFSGQIHPLERHNQSDFTYFGKDAERGLLLQHGHANGAASKSTRHAHTDDETIHALGEGSGKITSYNARTGEEDNWVIFGANGLRKYTLKAGIGHELDLTEGTMVNLIVTSADVVMGRPGSHIPVPILEQPVKVYR